MYREETDSIGTVNIPVDALYGIHTARALSNFVVSGRSMSPVLVRALATVKLAAVRTNIQLGCAVGCEEKWAAIEQACEEITTGQHMECFKVDALQGGAGTSANMNVNEVVANRALQIIGDKPGEYQTISPLDDVNRHQSTNDVFPTGVKLAAIGQFKILEDSIVALQETFQNKETEFAGIVKVARTQMQDAVLTTLGRQMSAYADVLSRDRWRIYKCEERLRVVNLGGTAIGTGIGAPRKYIFSVVDELRSITGIGFARADNLVECTQNVDVFVEVSGILKALASSLIKIASDLRFLSSGPHAGIGELRLPVQQAGSSIMPGKVNPVIPEAVTQAAMQVMGNDVTIGMAAASGNLELNAFLPVIADCLLGSIQLLANAASCLNEKCIAHMSANESTCNRHILGSTGIATSLVHSLGYETANKILTIAQDSGAPIDRVAIDGGYLSRDQFDELVSPESVCRLGSEDV